MRGKLIERAMPSFWSICILLSAFLVSCGKEGDEQSEEAFIDPQVALVCTIELDEFSVDQQREGFKLLRISVVNPTDSPVEFPGWITVPGASDVFSCRSGYESIDVDATIPRAEILNRTIIRIPEGEELVWHSALPPISAHESLVNRGIEISIPYFRNCRPLKIRLTQDDDGELRMREESKE